MWLWLGQGLRGIVGGIGYVVDGLLLLRVVLGLGLVEGVRLGLVEGVGLRLVEGVGLGLVEGVGLVLHIVLNYLVRVGVRVGLIHLVSHNSISSLHLQ